MPDLVDGDGDEDVEMPDLQWDESDEEPEQSSREAKSRKVCDKSKSSKDSKGDDGWDDAGTEPTQADIDNYTNYQKHLFALNKSSALDIRTSVEFASRAGARGQGSIRKAGNKGSQPQNLNRDLKRTFVKGSAMPNKYYCEVIGKHPETGENNVAMMIPILLLHEMLCWLLETSKIALAHMCEAPEESGMSQKHEDFSKQSGMDKDRTAIIGQHQDGVPFQKNQSLEVISWNLRCVLY